MGRIPKRGVLRLFDHLTGSLSQLVGNYQIAVKLIREDRKLSQGPLGIAGFQDQEAARPIWIFWRDLIEFQLPSVLLPSSPGETAERGIVVQFHTHSNLIEVPRLGAIAKKISGYRPWPNTNR